MSIHLFYFARCRSLKRLWIAITIVYCRKVSEPAPNKSDFYKTRIQGNRSELTIIDLRQKCEISIMRRILN